MISLALMVATDPETPKMIVLNCDYFSIDNLLLMISLSVDSMLLIIIN